MGVFFTVDTTALSDYIFIEYELQFATTISTSQ